jgi:Flp pilus assembly protein TadG
MRKFPKSNRLSKPYYCVVAASRWTRRCLVDRAGTAAVEFGMVIPVFLAMVFGTVEFARYMWSEHALDYAAEQASRYALANPSASNTDVKTYAENQVMTVNESKVTITVVDENLDGIEYLKVTVTHPFETLLPLVPFGPFTLTRVARIPTGS